MASLPNTSSVRHDVLTASILHNMTPCSLTHKFIKVAKQPAALLSTTSMQVAGSSVSSVKEASYSKMLLNFYQTTWYKVTVKTTLLNISLCNSGQPWNFQVSRPMPSEHYFRSI